MPTCGAARPPPSASYIVSYMASIVRARVPSTSSTSFARCFSTGSPNWRIWYVVTKPGYQAELLKLGLREARSGGAGRVKKSRRGALLELGTDLAQHVHHPRRCVGTGLPRGVRDRVHRAGVREGPEPFVQLPRHR